MLYIKGLRDGALGDEALKHEKVGGFEQATRGMKYLKLARMAYRCKSCRKHFSVRTSTVLAESRLPLLKWLLAIYMLSGARKGTP